MTSFFKKKFIKSLTLLFLKQLSRIISPLINYLTEINFEKNMFRIQNDKWNIIPGDQNKIRANSQELLKLSDKDLLNKFNQFILEDKSNYRSEYRKKYILGKNYKKILDLGCGLGRDGIFLAERGFEVTFADVIPSNIKLVEKICKLKKLNCKFKLIQSYEDYGSLGTFDLILAMGSLHHMPKKVTKKIIQIMFKNFESNKTKFLILSYPYKRWKNDGCLPYRFWGLRTDGGAPWTEYFTLDKILFIFSQNCELIDEYNYNDEFIYFYLTIKK